MHTARAAAFSTPYDTISTDSVSLRWKEILPPQCKQLLGIERDEFADQCAERRARYRLGGKGSPRQPAPSARGSLERQPSDDAKAAAAPALQRPQRVGFGTGIGEPYRVVGGHHFGLQ